MNELFDFVVKYMQPYTHIRLHLWLARIEAEIGKKEVGQESDLREVRTEVAGEGVLPVALGGEDRVEGADIRG